MLYLSYWEEIIKELDCEDVLCGGTGDNSMKKLDFYYIDLKYIRDLSCKDDNVMSI